MSFKSNSLFFLCWECWSFKQAKEELCFRDFICGNETEINPPGILKFGVSGHKVCRPLPGFKSSRCKLRRTCVDIWGVYLSSNNRRAEAFFKCVRLSQRCFFAPQNPFFFPPKSWSNVSVEMMSLNSHSFSAFCLCF